MVIEKRIPQRGFVRTKLWLVNAKYSDDNLFRQASPSSR